MHHRILLIAALAWPFIAACGRGAPEPAPPQHRAEEATETLVETRSASGMAAALVGNWELRSDPPQRMPGFRLTVTVDSAAGVRYSGRLTNYFSGNVGVDTRMFKEFVDSIRPDGSVAFIMPTYDSAMLGIQLEGDLTADTIHLGTFVLGPDTLSKGTRRWILVKRD